MGADLKYPDGVAQLRKLLETNDFVERHINGPVLSYVEDVDILLTVREPISQIVSNYLHILREPASPLHQAAKQLSPQAFFSQFGDLLGNLQTRYFITAYRSLHPDIDRLVSWPAIMLECLDRVRWYVPTEAIDEFCMLWQLETSRQMYLPSKSINIAETTKVLRTELEDIVRNMSEIYSIDLLLWHIARQRYNEYKLRVLSYCLPQHYQDNWGKVWVKDVLGIWLGRGWHEPQATDYGLAYWAGPDRLSEIRYKRDSYHRFLRVSIIVFCGVSERDVRFITLDGNQLPCKYRRIDEREVKYEIDIEMTDENGVILMQVPKVWSPIMVSTDTTDTSRRSVATCKWGLSTKALLQGLDYTCLTYSNIENMHAGDMHGIQNTD